MFLLIHLLSIQYSALLHMLFKIPLPHLDTRALNPRALQHLKWQQHALSTRLDLIHVKY
jgi:hypothetical protein